MIRAAAALALAVMAGPVAAAQQCAPRDLVLAHLSDKYSETRRGIGITANGAVIEVFASGAGTWTITVTLPDGRMCLVASGHGYETVSEALPPQGTPG